MTMPSASSLDRCARRALAVALAAAAWLPAGRALASPGPADDRLIQAPVNWTTRHSISVADLTTINDTGALRITDLRVEGTAPLTLSATLVRNTGAYAVQNPFFFHGTSFADAIDTFRANGKRPIVMQPYVENGVVKCAGITVPNTGANHRNWIVVRGGYDFVTQNLPSGYRPMTIGTYLNTDGTRHYAVIAVENTEGYAWWWYFRVHADQLDSLAGPFSSLIDASADDNDAMDLNVVYYNLPTTHGVTQGTPFFAASEPALINDAVSLRDRPLFITHFTLHGSGTADGDTEFFSSLVDNF